MDKVSRECYTSKTIRLGNTQVGGWYYTAAKLQRVVQSHMDNGHIEYAVKLAETEATIYLEVEHKQPLPMLYTPTMS
jgi:hypothetical protein